MHDTYLGNGWLVVTCLVESTAWVRWTTYWWILLWNFWFSCEHVSLWVIKCELICMSEVVSMSDRKSWNDKLNASYYQVSCVNLNCERTTGFNFSISHDSWIVGMHTWCGDDQGPIVEIQNKAWKRSWRFGDAHPAHNTCSAQRSRLVGSTRLAQTSHMESLISRKGALSMWPLTLRSIRRSRA